MKMQNAMAGSRSSLIENAVVRGDADRSSRLLDKAFAFAFRRLVYAQIWEDRLGTGPSLE